MKAIGIVGSPRKEGNTEIIASHALKAIEEEGIETELIRLSGLTIKPCNACMVCAKKETCPLDDDLLPIYAKMKEADAIILASPVYFGSATALLKAFIERAGYIAYNNGSLFDGKIGGALVVAGRSGQNFTLAELTLWFQILGFSVPSSPDWNVSFGEEKGAVREDQEGMDTAWAFGKKIALLVKKLRA